MVEVTSRVSAETSSLEDLRPRRISNASGGPCIEADRVTRESPLPLAHPANRGTRSPVASSARLARVRTCRTRSRHPWYTPETLASARPSARTTVGCESPSWGSAPRYERVQRRRSTRLRMRRPFANRRRDVYFVTAMIARIASIALLISLPGCMSFELFQLPDGQDEPPRDGGDVAVASGPGARSADRVAGEDSGQAAGEIRDKRRARIRDKRRARIRDKRRADIRDRRVA